MTATSVPAAPVTAASVPAGVAPAAVAPAVAPQPAEMPNEENPGITAGVAENNGMTQEQNASAEPPAEDQALSTSEEFVSRRQELGQPRSVIPAASAELSEHATTSSSRAGAWYKLGAGLIFLLSLGYIGYRQKQSRRVPAMDWDSFEQPLSRWTPPQEKMTSGRNASSASAGRDSRTDPGRGQGADSFSASGGRDNDLIVRDAGLSRKSSPGRFDVYDEEPSADAGFHPEIEKRVRRKQMDSMSGYGPARLARGAGYAAIGELVARGYAADEIARHLGITTAEVRTYLQIEQRPMLD